MDFVIGTLIFLFLIAMLSSGYQISHAIDSADKEHYLAKTQEEKDRDTQRENGAMWLLFFSVGVALFIIWFILPQK